MSKIKCSIEEAYIENDYGTETEGVIATCSKCGHTTESYGTEENSIKRCLVLLRDQCPEGESNYYVEEPLATLLASSAYP